MRRAAREPHLDDGGIDRRGGGLAGQRPPGYAVGCRRTWGGVATAAAETQERPRHGASEAAIADTAMAASVSSVALSGRAGRLPGSLLIQRPRAQGPRRGLRLAATTLGHDCGPGEQRRRRRIGCFLMAVAVDRRGVLPVPQDRIDARPEADGVVIADRMGAGRRSAPASPTSVLGPMPRLWRSPRDISQTHARWTYRHHSPNVRTRRTQRSSSRRARSVCRSASARRRQRR